MRTSTLHAAWVALASLATAAVIAVVVLGCAALVQRDYDDLVFVAVALVVWVALGRFAWRRTALS